MNTKSLLILVSLSVAGLTAGYAAKCLTGSSAASSAAAASQNDRARSHAAAAAKPATVPVLANFPTLHSEETLETLAAIPDGQLYAKLALWLADASEPDIAAFWSTYSQKKGRSNDITDLVFLNWTRLDPQAAIAGSSSDQHAWWAWACHDPATALAYAKAHAQDHINHVAWGIGEFHPEWLRAHFKELSKGAQDNALQGLAKWDDGQDPLAAMKFLQEIGRSPSLGTFKALVRQDPWSALDWLKENPASRIGNGSADESMKLLVNTMADERPDDLERLAAQTPSGALKLQMQSAIFTNLLKTDLEAAMEQAKSTTVPRTAAERYAAIGIGIVKTDPEQAFELAKSLFAACPDAMQMMSMVEYPNGGSGSGITIPGVSEFVEKLVANDPARALEMTIGLKTTSHYGNSAFSTLSDQWATRDLVAYTNWVNRQTDAIVREEGASMVINKLQQQGNYAESADWVLSLKDGSSGYRVSDMLANWKRRDPEAPAEWLESADIPEARKAELRTYLDKQQ